VSENVCYTDAYARQTDAVVVETDPEAHAVLLDRTVFYPGGGGQPADTGRLVGDAGGSWTVTGAKKRGEDIWHTIGEGEELPAVDTQVVAEIDWERRHQLMRTHSALHVLCGVVWRDHSASVTGGNMEPLSGRMDFEFETMSGELVGEIERRVNEEVVADREIRVAVLPREEAFAIPDLIRTKINLLPEGITEVRTIEIVGLDLQADGGTHVAHTGEIGRVKVTGYESKGRINKRIRIEVTDAGAS
jgi:misacylated tRNA(Ala) deacylase